VKYRRNTPAGPCDVCRRVHPNRCKPTAARSVRVTLTLPGWVHRRLVDEVPWGERSAFLAAAVEAHLEEAS
jgi:hypothetical protein